MLIRMFFVFLVLFCPHSCYVTVLWPCKPFPQHKISSGPSVLKGDGPSPTPLEVDPYVSGSVPGSALRGPVAPGHLLCVPSGKVLKFCSVAGMNAPSFRCGLVSPWVSLHWYVVFNCCMWIIPYPQCDRWNSRAHPGFESFACIVWGKWAPPNTASLNCRTVRAPFCGTWECSLSRGKDTSWSWRDGKWQWPYATDTVLLLVLPRRNYYGLMGGKGKLLQRGRAVPLQAALGLLPWLRCCLCVPFPGMGLPDLQKGEQKRLGDE